MQQFEIRVQSVSDVLAFVSLATQRSFPITVGCDQHRVNGKSFMEMFSLDICKPLTVMAVCTAEEFASLMQDAANFLLK